MSHLVSCYLNLHHPVWEASPSASAEAGHKLLVHLELRPEEGVLGGVQGVPVHLKQGQVNARHGLDEALKGGGDLEFLEHAGGHTAGGGAGETDLEEKIRENRAKEFVQIS